MMLTPDVKLYYHQQ